MLAPGTSGPVALHSAACLWKGDSPLQVMYLWAPSRNYSGPLMSSLPAGTSKTSYLHLFKALPRSTLARVQHWNSNLFTQGRSLSRSCVQHLTGVALLQGRSFSLSYVQYFTERYAPLRIALASAASLRPTDVLVSVGAWLFHSNMGCERWDFTPGRAPPALNDSSICPSMPALCRAFAWNAEGTGQAFKLWWNAPPPRTVNGTVVDVVAGADSPRARGAGFVFLSMRPRRVNGIAVAVVAGADLPATLQPPMRRAMSLWL